MDNLEQQFKSLERSLRKEIRETLETAISQLKRQDKQHAASQEVNSQPECPSVNVNKLAQDPIGGTKNQSSQKDSQSDRHFWIATGIQASLALFTLLAFIAAGIYACIANRQWETMNATYTEIQKQTTLAHQQLSGTMGAVLSMNAKIKRPDGVVEITIVPRGSVTARDIRGKYTVSLIQVTTNKALRQVSGEIKKDQMQANVGDVYQTNVDIGEINISEIEHFRQTVRVNASYTYNNGFDDVGGEPDFCEEAIPDRISPNKYVYQDSMTPCYAVIGRIRQYREFDKQEQQKH